MPTPDIFDFDAEDLATYDQSDIDKILVEQPGLYINHLRIARSIDGWASRLEERGGGINADFQRGYQQALREIAAHLRQGDYVEGGAMIINQEA
ncbi:hypothetical protein [Mycobacterium colombiense]|uniref:hypothetical protein n=1 Tax=Mycobacterium colombiense TaxID=339268 RepID=UPI00096E3564|nr:hypothetical protein [Mycobacterium colombiense]OMC28876.1 hypothetical protein A5738_22545 [Mycobacterium colombiense]